MKAFAITRAAAEGSNIPFIHAIELPMPVSYTHLTLPTKA